MPPPFAQPTAMSEQNASRYCLGNFWNFTVVVARGGGGGLRADLNIACRIYGPGMPTLCGPCAL